LIVGYELRPRPTRTLTLRHPGCSGHESCWLIRGRLVPLVAIIPTISFSLPRFAKYPRGRLQRFARSGSCRRPEAALRAVFQIRIEQFCRSWGRGKAAFPGKGNKIRWQSVSWSGR
jgi:hypothetical protein